MRAKSKANKRRRRRKSMRPRHAAFDGFYAPRFSRQERAGLAALVELDSLEGEIALLRILIRRRLAKPPPDQLQDGGATLSVDVEKIRRYVETLCRAVKTHRSLGDNTSQEDEAMHRVLAEIVDEINLTGASGEFAAPLSVSRSSPSKERTRFTPRYDSVPVSHSHCEITIGKEYKPCWAWGGALWPRARPSERGSPCPYPGGNLY